VVARADQIHLPCGGRTAEMWPDSGVTNETTEAASTALRIRLATYVTCQTA